MHPAEAHRPTEIATSVNRPGAAEPDIPSDGLAAYAWVVLGFNLLVILWGAYVRASGSGAGCGSHWPLCNGEIVPRDPALATVIELTHRVTSGLALLLVAGLVFAARRRRPRGAPVRWAAGLAAFFIVTEALLGAGLVVLEYVADDRRAARGFWVAGHLVNTFLLVAALALTARWASGGKRRLAPVRVTTMLAIGAALAGMLVLGMSGAVTALGDTLFPATSWAAGKAQTFAESSHVFLRLRLWHPTIALAVGIAVVLAAAGARRAQRTPGVLRLALGSIALYALQLLLGLANMRLLAPVGLQMVHLLLANLCWITVVLLAAELALPGGRMRAVPAAANARARAAR
jgi:heme A synthase